MLIKQLISLLEVFSNFIGHFYRLTPVSKPVSKRLVLGIMGRQDETYEHVNP